MIDMVPVLPEGVLLHENILRIERSSKTIP